MLQPGSNRIGWTTPTKYILGLSFGVVTLERLKFGDIAERNRRELINENLITFDENWPTSTTKRYIFEFQCRDVLLVFQTWYDHNIGKFIRIVGPKSIDYGFIQTNGLQVTNNARLGGDIEMTITCLFEVPL